MSEKMPEKVWVGFVGGDWIGAGDDEALDRFLTLGIDPIPYIPESLAQERERKARADGRREAFRELHAKYVADADECITNIDHAAADHYRARARQIRKYAESKGEWDSAPTQGNAQEGT